MKEEDLLIGGNKDIIKAREEAKEKAFIERTRNKLYEEFLANPSIIPIQMVNRRVVIPAISVDPYHKLIGTSISEKALPKSDKEIEDEKRERAKTPQPIVAYDNKLKEEGLITDQVQYAIIYSFQNIVKEFYYNGLPFWVFDLHEIVGFVDKNNLPLLTSEVPPQEVQKLKESLSNESSIQ